MPSRTFRSCGEGNGLQTARQCVHPGNIGTLLYRYLYPTKQNEVYQGLANAFLVDFPGYFWQPGVYYQDRVAVFTTIIAIIMAGIAVIGVHGCRQRLQLPKRM